MTFQKCEFTTLCFAPSWHCDGANDCGDFSDEKNCPGILSPSEIHIFFFPQFNPHVVFKEKVKLFFSQIHESNLDYSKWNKKPQIVFHLLKGGWEEILLLSPCWLSSLRFAFFFKLVLFCHSARERENKVSYALLCLSEWTLYPHELDVR